MNDLSVRLAALSPVKRELLMRRLNERSMVAVRPVNGAARSSLSLAGDEECEPPVTMVEEVLVQLWAEALGRDKVSTTSDFFKMGGHSLLATQLVVRISEILGVELPIIAMFAHPTIRELSEQIERGRLRQEDIPPIIPTSRDEPAPISYSQERIWFLNKLEPESLAYNVSRAVRFFGDLKVDSLERVFSELIRRHEILRTTFPSVDGRAIQHVHPPCDIAIPVRDLTHVAEADRFREIERRYRSAQQRFDLEEGPLLRLELLRFSTSEYALIIGEHHLLHDGWTQGVLMRELIALYSAFVEGKPSPLEEPRLQYSDFARWQRKWLDSGVMEKQLGYWTKQLQNVSVLELPSDRARTARTSAGDRYPFDVPGELADRLRQLARAHGATLFMVLLAAFKILLSRYAGSEDICVGTGIANRRRKESEALLGMFVNTVVLRAQALKDLTFSEFLRRVRVVCVDAYANQDVPFNKVVEAIQPERSPVHPPLYRTMFSFHDSPSPRMGLPGVKVKVAPLHNRTAKFDLNVIGVPYTELLEGDEAASRAIFMSWEYATDLFDRSTIKRMAGHYKLLLESIACDPELQLGDLMMLSEAERRQIVEEWNNIAAEHPRDKCLHELFAERAAGTPEAVALIHEGRELSYGELDRRSNQLAHHLRERGVGPESVVGLCVERSFEMVIGLLGILKAGAAYLPLDPGYPTGRLAYMLSDAKVAALVTRDALLGRLPEHGTVLVRLDQDWAEIARQPSTCPQNLTLPDNLAYVIYTSGSTGRPKGVMACHRGLANYLHFAAATYCSGEIQSSFVNTSLSFDATITSLLAPLVEGLAVHLARNDKEIESFGETASSGTPSRLFKITPAHLSLLPPLITSGDLSDSRNVMVVGGEQLNADTVRPWLRVAPSTRLFNEYGPTETTVGSTIFEATFPADGIRSIPIGHPIRNTKIYVLDAAGRPVAVGVSGELYIGGAGLARGYLNRPGLTADRFVPSPFGEGERLYRTGDLARWRADGELEYLGRIDHQVKIRGYRIELGEIEARLAEHDSVARSVVVVDEDESGQRRLVAYVVAEKDNEMKAAELRAHLQGSLPEYMVPSMFVQIDSVPLTLNGKIDRKALRSPGPAAIVRDNHVAPRTPTEEALASIWQEVLGLDRVGGDDNFFELGGHSLLAMRVITRILDSLEIELPLMTIFNNPKLSAFAAAVDDELRLERSPDVGREACSLERAFDEARHVPECEER